MPYVFPLSRSLHFRIPTCEQIRLALLDLFRNYAASFMLFCLRNTFHKMVTLPSGVLPTTRKTTSTSAGLRALVLGLSSSVYVTDRIAYVMLSRTGTAAP